MTQVRRDRLGPFDRGNRLGSEGSAAVCAAVGGCDGEGCSSDGAGERCRGLLELELR